MPKASTGIETYDVRQLMFDVFKETVALREGGATVFDEIEGPELAKGRKKLLHLQPRAAN